jgi:hypothetical protein
MNITIRGINPKFWRQVRVKAVEQGMATGEAVNLALKRWIETKEEEKRKKKQKKSFWDLEPFEYKGEDAGKLSSKVDEIIYGWKK